MSLQLVGFGIQQELLVTKAFKLDFGFEEAFHGCGWRLRGGPEMLERGRSLIPVILGVFRASFCRPVFGVVLQLA